MTKKRAKRKSPAPRRSAGAPAPLAPAGDGAPPLRNAGHAEPAPQAKPGRPTKLTPELQASVVEAIRAGNYVETAAAFAGIDKTTLYDWLRQGATAGSGPYHEFSHAVKAAQAAAEVRDVMLIGKAAATQWQAAAWRLERKFPDRWGRKVQVGDLAKLSDAELWARLKEAEVSEGLNPEPESNG